MDLYSFFIFLLPSVAALTLFVVIWLILYPTQIRDILTLRHNTGLIGRFITITMRTWLAVWIISVLLAVLTFVFLSLTN